MSRPLAILVLALLAPGCGGARTEEASRTVTFATSRPTAVVATVTDGDTIRLADGRRVRLVQIDAPEVNGDPECGGAAARAALRDRLARGARVKLEADPALDERDRHGRLLRYVFHDGRNLNEWMVANGHAAPYFYRGERGRYARDLLRAAQLARSERRGAWGDCRQAEFDPDRGLSTGPPR